MDSFAAKPFLRLDDVLDEQPGVREEFKVNRLFSNGCLHLPADPLEDLIDQELLEDLMVVEELGILRSNVHQAAEGHLLALLVRGLQEVDEAVQQVELDHDFLDQLRVEEQISVDLERDQHDLVLGGVAILVKELLKGAGQFRVNQVVLDVLNVRTIGLEYPERLNQLSSFKLVVEQVLDELIDRVLLRLLDLAGVAREIRLEVKPLLLEDCLVLRLPNLHSEVFALELEHFKQRGFPVN